MPKYVCVSVCVNLPSTWEQGVTPTFRLQGAIQPCYQEWSTKSLIARCYNVPARGPKSYPRCARDRIQSLLFGILKILRPARSSHSDHGNNSHSLYLILGTEIHSQHINARDRSLIPTTRHLITTKDKTLILTIRHNDDDIHSNIRHSSIFLTSSLCRIISVIQRGSVNDSRAAIFRHGAVVVRKGSLVMNQYDQFLVQMFGPPVQL